jgi:stage III sporulation protein SpoIIIAA
MAAATQIKITDDVDLLLGVMPPHIQKSIGEKEDRHSLIEIVLDLGRIPEARYADHTVVELPEQNVSREEIDYVVKRVGKFTEDNRAGIERTLHRISAIRNRLGTIVGLTCRVGRAVFGTVDIVRDVIESGRSILLLGRPGVGKTTLLRESARVLADELRRRVVIVDTSNEIGGDGDIPHPGIGRARRMQVSSPDRQHAVMIEAVENHMPEVIVIDEIGTETEASAARTIAERGVQLIATAHGNTLENLIRNPTLSGLVGGIQAVTLSDEEARRRGTQKTVLERKTAPTFQVLVEIQDKDSLAVHHDVARVVDAFLRRISLSPEIRVRNKDGGIEIRQPQEEILPWFDLEKEKVAESRQARSKDVRIFTYGVSRTQLERVIQKLDVPAQVVADLSRADIILTLKSQQRRQPRALRQAHAGGLPLHVIRNNTLPQMEDFLRFLFHRTEGSESRDKAIEEAQSAVFDVLEHGQPVELFPRSSFVRRLQHQLAESHGLSSTSRGREPRRFVIIYPMDTHELPWTGD